MTPSQRDIVLIRVPFTDLTSTKQRPVLVLSNTQYNHRGDDVVVAAITSQPREGSYGIRITRLDLEKGLLRRQSVVLADKIYTLSKRIIRKRLGKLNQNVFNTVLDRIDAVWGRQTNS